MESRNMGSGIFWDWHVAFGEFIGSFILTITILFSVLIAKREKFGLDTKWKRKGFQAVAIPASVVVGIVSAHMFGGTGFINPAIAFIAGVLIKNFDSVGYISAAELAGGVFAFIILILTVKINNVGTKNKEDNIDLSKIFIYNKQNILKSQGAELLSNTLWLLPISGLLIGVFHQNPNFGNLGFASVYELAAIIALGLVVVILVFGEFGVANLNPAVWIGEFLTRIVAQKSITGIELGKELLTAINALAVGAACGGIGLISIIQ